MAIDIHKIGYIIVRQQAYIGSICGELKQINGEKMKDQKNFYQHRESSVNINNIQHKTLNTNHLALNTTFAQEATKKCEVLSSRGPLAPSSTDNNIVNGIDYSIPGDDQPLDRKKLDQLEQQARTNSVSGKYKPNPRAKEQFEEWRKNAQESRDKKAKSLQDSDSLFRIEVSLKKKQSWNSTKINIDILLMPGMKFDKYTSVMQNKRMRSLTANANPAYLDWWGYAKGKELIKQGQPVGKIKMRQNAKGTKIATKIVPKTLATIWLDEEDLPVVTLLINNSTYEIPLEEIKGVEYFSHKGIWECEEEWLDD